MGKTYAKTVKIGPFQFRNTWVFYGRRFRLLPAQVNKDGYIPVISVENKRNVCKMPTGFEGRSVGALDSSTTNVFEPETGRILCHIFNLSHVFNPKRPLEESKYHRRLAAIVFGDEPYVENISLHKQFGLEEFFHAHLNTHPTYPEQIDLNNEIFSFGFWFHVKNLRQEIMSPEFGLDLNMARAQKIGSKQLSSVELRFNFKGEFINSMWDINLGDKNLEGIKNTFPFTWKNLTPVGE